MEIVIKSKLGPKLPMTPHSETIPSLSAVLPQRSILLYLTFTQIDNSIMKLAVITIVEVKRRPPLHHDGCSNLPCAMVSCHLDPQNSN